MTERTIAELQSVTFTYPDSQRPALDRLTIDIREGEFLLVVGPSGCGKSTLLRTLNGLVPHFSGGRFSGQVRVAGKDPVAAGPHEMSTLVGLVQQDPESQFVVDTVEDELAFGMENQGIAPAVMRGRVEEVLQQLGIVHLRNRRISALSAGEKQRVAIGSVLTLRPRLLVLDEPTSQLDPRSADEVLSTLRCLNADLGLTVICSEHRLERVVPYADRILYLSDLGARPVLGPPEQVLMGMPYSPPLTQLAKAFDWRPVPTTVEEAEPFRSRLGPLPKAYVAHQTLVGSPAPVVLQVQGLYHSYNSNGTFKDMTSAALKGIDFQARQGELIALMGRNGSGKTTLLKHLVGLITPQMGSVLVHGMDTSRTQLDELIRHVGYVPQDPGSLLFADSVREELEFTRKAHRLPPADTNQWLNQLGLSRLGDRYPRSLSVGERQRAALAAILVAEPDTLLLDEPTRGLDPLEKQTLARFLKAQTASGRTVILVTHDTELAAECAGRIVIMSEGRIVVDAPPAEAMAEAPAFATQVARLFDSGLLTVSDVLEAYAHAD
ncbi:MAG: putative HMP/thiamine import ATP-binding protein YkoD [Chloroflexi bacterium ADurb.Bin180]|nr:MAG: putative HMP/thiamine import ATP-binding protein YkoD [Chloroflexi bacterium ADurb.Bin180]